MKNKKGKFFPHFHQQVSARVRYEAGLKLPDIKEDDRRFGDAYVATFESNGVKITIRFKLFDEQSGADLVITSTTVLPRTEVRKGHGRRVVSLFVETAHENGFKNIQAVQVGRESEGFWLKMGFVKLNNPTNDFLYKGESTRV